MKKHFVRNKKLLLVTGILILAWLVYWTSFTDRALWKQVFNADRFKLSLEQEQIPVRFFIPVASVAFIDELGSGDKKQISLPVWKTDETQIILDNVMRHDQELYFSFTLAHDMHLFRGHILHNSLIHADGSVSVPGENRVVVYDADGKRIELGSTGTGPDADFSFGIRNEDLQQIAGGFYVEYTGYYLYAYSRKQLF